MKGLGCDLLSLTRFHKVYQRFPERIATKILSPIELIEYRKTLDWKYIAVRFCVKEAAYKATQAHTWQQLSLLKYSRKPVLTSTLKHKLMVTISHERDLCMAVVCWVD